MNHINSGDYSHDLNLSSAIPASLLESLVHDGARFRIFDPVTTLHLFLMQALKGLSTRETIAEFNVKRTLSGEKSVSLNTGAFIRAREKLCEYKLKKIATYEPKKSGRRFFHVDGTTFQTFDNQLNQSEYPQNPKQRPGLGQPILRAVLIFCATSGRVVEYLCSAYSGKGTAEPSLFRKLMSYFNEGDVIIGDRFYSGFGLCKEMQGLKLGFIVRARDKIVQCRIGKFRDRWIRLKDPTRKTTDTLNVRMIKFKSKKNGFRDKEFYFYTNLSEGDFTKDQIAEIYMGRWNCELNLRNLKRTLGCYLINAKSPSMTRKNIAVKILAYNLTRKIIAQCRGNSFKRSFKLAKTLISQVITLKSSKKSGFILQLLESYSLNSPPRFEVRALKRRHKGTYGYLMSPRSSYVAANAIA